MKDIATFKELVEAAVSGTLPDGWIYRPRDAESVLGSKFSVTTSDDDVELDLVEVDGEEIVRSLHEAGMAPWIDSATFEDVVSSREEKTGKRDIDDLVKAVEYYLENDDFMD
jgi:hypothetical protein